MTFKLEKLSDLEFNGDHPNKVNEKYTIKRAIINLEASETNNVLFVHDGPNRWFHTSIVQRQSERDGYDLLYTLNSIYKITLPTHETKHETSPSSENS